MARRKPDISSTTSPATTAPDGSKIPGMPAAAKKTAAEPRADAGAAQVIDLNKKTIARVWAIVNKNPALEKIYTRLLEIVSEANLEEADRRYSIGRLVAQVRQETDKYRKGSVEKLATLLGFDTSTLHDYANVADTWQNKTEFNALLRQESERGFGLRFSHLVVLARVADEKHRKKLIALALEMSLTVRQLENYVRTEAASADEPAPPALSGAVDRARHVVAFWEGAVDQVDRDTRELERLAASSPDVLPYLQKTAEKQRALAETASACAAKLEALAKAGSAR
jgi:hypothetical protein